MIDKLTDNELLGWIEGDLTPTEAARVREALGSNPAAFEVFERLRRDRAILQADPEPVLPVDLVAELEPILAKPMLLGAATTTTQPSAYRGVHRRANIRRWSQTLLAAGFVIAAASAGMALLLNLIEPSGGNDDGPLAAGGAEDNPGAAADGGRNEATSPTETRLADSDADVHHWDAVPGATDLASAGSTQSPTSEPVARVALRGGEAAIESRFALTITPAERDAVVSRLTTMVADMGESALVRNFSYEDARARWREMVAAANVAERDRLLQSLGASATGALLSDSQKSDVRFVVGSTETLLGENLAGSPDFAAKPDDQLRLSDSGAVLSITLPAADLLPLLEELDRSFGAFVSLRPLGADSQVDAWTRWQSWSEAIRSMRDELSSVDGTAPLHVVVPIAVR